MSLTRPRIELGLQAAEIITTLLLLITLVLVALGVHYLPPFAGGAVTR